MKARQGHKYRFETRCPHCGKFGEIFHKSLSPTVCCGDCLINDLKIIHLDVVRLPDLITREDQMRAHNTGEPLRATGYVD